MTHDPRDTSPGRLTGYLTDVAACAHGRLPWAGGVGVTLLVEGRPVFAGSNPFTRAIDEVQYGSDDGPCLKAAASGRVVRSRTIGAGESRWPRFAVRAAALGLRSVVSGPVLTDDVVIGSVNVYGQTAGCLDKLDDELLQRHAESSASLMNSVALLASVDVSSAALTGSLDRHTDIALAVGLLMARHHTPENEARTELRLLAARAKIDAQIIARLLVEADQAPHRRSDRDHA